MARRVIVRRHKALLEGEPLDYFLHRVAGRRHVHLVVEETGELQVRAPYRFTRVEAERVIRAHAAWLAAALRRARERNARRPKLESGAELPLLDERLKLDVNPVQQADLFERRSALADGEIFRQRNVLRVRTRQRDHGDLRALLEAWYRAEARRYLLPRLDRLGSELDLRPSRVSIRAQKTRWGSCSERGGISLNWRLMLLPSMLVEYVLVHELCHLRHLNHSPRFWALLGSLMPDYRSLESQLEELQGKLAL